MVMVVIATRVRVPPVPICLLVVRPALTIFAVLALGLCLPTMIGGVFVRVPAMIIVIIGVVDAIIVVLSAARVYHWDNQSRR